MSLYVISCIDRPGQLDLRLATRAAHLAYAKETDLVQIHAGGPYLSNAGAMIGSMLIVEADQPENVDAFVADDPYGKAGLFERVEIRTWKITVGTLG